MNTLKGINALRNGALVPEELKDAVDNGGASAFTDALRRMIERDGCLFVGSVEQAGVEVENHQLRGPLTRDPPPQYKDGKE